jgi:hypothetical protein
LSSGSSLTGPMVSSVGHRASTASAPGLFSRPAVKSSRRRLSNARDLEPAWRAARQLSSAFPASRRRRTAVKAPATARSFVLDTRAQPGQLRNRGIGAHLRKACMTRANALMIETDVLDDSLRSCRARRAEQRKRSQSCQGDQAAGAPGRHALLTRGGPYEC